jgi:hypothetical protein
MKCRQAVAPCVVCIAAVGAFRLAFSLRDEEHKKENKPCDCNKIVPCPEANKKSSGETNKMYL